jgi:hypothetical protein
VTEDKYGALLRHVYEFCWHVAAGSAKSADPILHREPPLLKDRGGAILKIKEGMAYLSLDLSIIQRDKSRKRFRENVPLTKPDKSNKLNLV